MTKADQWSALVDMPTDEESLIRHCTLDRAELDLIQAKRAPHNRLGLTIQLSFLRHLGRAVLSGETSPAPMVAFVAQQIGVNPGALAEYGPVSGRRPEHYRYELDVVAIAEVWRRGSVVSSWLLDLPAAALRGAPGLGGFAGHVSDSGEGGGTLQATIDEGVPAPVIATVLFARFGSRGQADYADRLLSALRLGFGGHVEKTAQTPVADPPGTAAH